MKIAVSISVRLGKMKGSFANISKHYTGQWQCSSCRFRTTLRSGTMMDAKLPDKYLI
jgi:hypothetical protein